MIARLLRAVIGPGPPRVIAKEEHSGAYRVTVLFVLAGLFVLAVDLSQGKLSSETEVELKGVTQVEIVLDKCEVLFKETKDEEKLVVNPGLGRIVALHRRSSSSYQIY